MAAIEEIKAVSKIRPIAPIRSTVLFSNAQWDLTMHDFGASISFGSV